MRPTYIITIQGIPQRPHYAEEAARADFDAVIRHGSVTAHPRLFRINRDWSVDEARWASSAFEKVQEPFTVPGPTPQPAAVEPVSVA